MSKPNSRRAASTVQLRSLAIACGGARNGCGCQMMQIGAHALSPHYHLMLLLLRLPRGQRGQRGERGGGEEAHALLRVVR
jgi:hypothetical protein